MDSKPLFDMDIAYWFLVVKSIVNEVGLFNCSRCFGLKSIIIAMIHALSRLLAVGLNLDPHEVSLLVKSTTTASHLPKQMQKIDCLLFASDCLQILTGRLAER